MTAEKKPTGFLYVKYCYGAALPASMIEWVARDLAGPGAARRMVLRWSVPCLLLLAPMLLVDTSMFVRANMTIPILAPYIMFSIALNKVYRRHRLQQHGLDQDLVNDEERVRNASAIRTYKMKYRGA